VLDAGGFALTLQNGIGNLETLSEVLGQERVVGGSTMCSFRVEGPGHVRQTHAGPTTMGEIDGHRSERVDAVASMLRQAGYEVVVTDDITRTIWTKLIVNLAINPICAVTGLRLGEFARLEATDRFQDRLLDEAFAVVRARGLGLDEAGLRSKIKAHSWSKFSEPSMLQHVNAGRRTEIDAINGALVREAKALGVPVPFNEALSMLIKGRELRERQRASGIVQDWAALEHEAALAPRESA
jgi:2-dehydropantoate 2-reductase